MNLAAVPQLARTEVEVAADLIMALHHAGLLTDRTLPTLTRAAEVARLSLQDLKDADGRRERHVATPPKPRVPVIPGGVPQTPPPPPGSSWDARRRATDYEPTKKADKVQCPRCRLFLASSKFEGRSNCDGCRRYYREREAQRREQERMDDVERIQAGRRLSIPARQIEVTATDGRLVLTCRACGIEIGEHDEMVAFHAGCAPKVGG